MQLRGHFPAVLPQAIGNNIDYGLHAPLLVPAQGHSSQLYFNCNFIPQRRMNAQNKSTPLLINKNILSRDSIFKRLDQQNEYSLEDKARESNLYQRLEKKMESEREEHLEFVAAADQRIARLAEMIQKEKAGIHGKKIDLWELKNEVMQLHEMIEQDQQEEYEEEDSQYELEGEEQQEGEDSEEQAGSPRDLSQLLQKWGIKKESSPSLIQNGI